MQRINEDIKNGQLKQIYLLYGEQAYLRRQCRDKLKMAIVGSEDTMNYNYYEGKGISVPEVIDVAETLPFLAEKRLIIVENSGLFKAGGEALAAYLESIPETTCFVFVEAEVDKRSKLFKIANSAGRAIELGEQNADTLKRWVLGMVKKEQLNISEATIEYFLTKVGTDMETIQRESEKLFCYCMGKGTITTQDIDAICTQKISNHIFDMVEAIAQKQQKKALNLYYDLIMLRESPMRILALITRQFNLLLQVKDLRNRSNDNDKIAKKVGLPSFVVKKYVAQASSFKSEQIKEALKACADADEAFKTGRMTEKMCVELVIIQTSNSNK